MSDRRQLKKELEAKKAAQWHYVDGLEIDTVLALIAENDRLDLDNRSLKGSCSRLGAEHAQMTRTLKKANRMQLEARQERDQLKTENEALLSVMSAVTSEIPRGEYIKTGNAPGHCHDIPGVWDQGNGEKSGKVCGWCKVWNAAAAMSKKE